MIKRQYFSNIIVANKNIRIYSTVSLAISHRSSIGQAATEAAANATFHRRVLGFRDNHFKGIDNESSLRCDD